jgi:hypothetical protein
VVCCKSIAKYRKGFGRSKSKFKISPDLEASRFLAASLSAKHIAERCQPLAGGRGAQRRQESNNHTKSG